MQKTLYLKHSCNQLAEYHEPEMRYEVQYSLILAAPPARMEIIGEHVDSIYLTIHKGNTSTVEENSYEAI